MLLHHLTYQHATAPAVAGTNVAGNGTYGASSAKITSDNSITITAATNANPVSSPRRQLMDCKLAKLWLSVGRQVIPPSMARVL